MPKSARSLLKNMQEQLKLRTGRRKLRQHVASSERDEQRLAALNTISGLITQSPDIHHVANLVNDKIMEAMDVDAVLIFLVEEETPELVLDLYKGVSEEFVAGVRRMKVGEGFNGSVVQTGKPLIVEDSTTNPLLTRQVVISEGIKSQLIVPLQAKGMTVGSLCVARRVPGSFHTDEVMLLSSIGSQIAASLENTRLYEEMEQALVQSHESEERYRSLFQHSNDAIWVHDLKANMLALNAACERFTGYSSDELKGMCIDTLMDPYGKSCIEHIEGSLLRDEPIDHRCEAKLDKKDGSKVIMEVTTSLIRHAGKTVSFQHSARDITDKRRIEENLHYYLQQVTRAQEEERKRIARELHDETLQNLIAMSRQLDKITSSEALWKESIEEVRHFKKQLEAAIQELRRFTHDLRPSVLDDLGLLPALQLLVDDLEKQGIATSFNVFGEARRFSDEAEVTLFRIAQEAMRNIWRHAQASAAELFIEFSNGKVGVSIGDDGNGFTLPPRPGDLASSGKLGLAGIDERVRSLGGNLTLNSNLGRGTRIDIEAPL